ncbi:hypothetical protein ARALYDRAFT_894807 [Arabidopsis lyrata subsp. lyrata]|uniref:Late embryogenesis abundant protein LEA-2 subgroup domain-containing protein n=1 Tax=Arabidopsis lyrata subsp. lyrata TaxID=81972 RepID=D7KXY0_ARALL|nr:hypothetical protein ARALYDRAFT_894807 [Arabidopsis lyrata subsp. lyrata]
MGGDTLPCGCHMVVVGCVYMVVVGCVYILIATNQETSVPNIEITSMDFTVHNITQTRLSANWDLLIRVPSDLPNAYICLQGDIQASLFYKNFTLVTSSGQRLYKFIVQSSSII